MKTLFATLLTVVSLSCPLTSAGAHTIDTGTPNGQQIGALALDANDYYAGQVSFTTGTLIQAAYAHVLGGAAGETFTVALYDNANGRVPGSALYSTTAIFGANGWNGAGGLAGWLVGAGTYWVAFEVGFGDTLGSSSIAGALLDVGAPNPLTRTAFDAGGAYVATSSPLSFGLQLDARAVPEPSTVALVFTGLALVSAAARRRRRPR